MMWAWLGFAVALGLLNLVLVLLVAKRLRLVSARMAAPGPAPWLPPGSAIGEFTATTVDGTPVSLDSLRGKNAVVGFFSTTCTPCREQVPLLATYLSGEAAPEIAVAVVVGAPDAGGFTEQLAGRALVIHEMQDGQVAEAFSARVFPALYLLDPEGKVVANGPGLGTILRARLDLDAARQ